MIFYWCSGQEDNIGDVILRRRMLRSLQSADECRVYVGRASPNFIRALGLQDRDVVYSNFLAFVLIAMLNCLRKDWKFAFNPGEIKCNRRQSLMHAALIPMMLISNTRGRRCIRIGVGIHEYSSRWEVFVKATVRLAGVNVWRDAESRARFDSGTVAPDWAFDEHGLSSPDATGEDPRGMLGVSLRSDGSAATETWLTAVRTLAQMSGLEPVVLVQVQRDSERSHEMAARLGCEVLDWTDANHSEQEARLREAYRTCAGVISDRLHVLVMAMTEGAVPLGLMEHVDNKVHKHFDAAGIDRISWDVRSWASEQIAERGSKVLGQRDGLFKQLVETQERIRQLDAMVKGL
ncbi:hypothetical protein ACPCXD_03500 [Rhodococcus sp. AB351]|uniref:hypothetical protein n=1 Tax=Rhodococcus sp. AB351 TaxID=3413280 RepID=UPI003C2A912B